MILLAGTNYDNGLGRHINRSKFELLSEIGPNKNKP